jgi:tRNA(Ile)-lysidine synthase
MSRTNPNASPPIAPRWAQSRVRRFIADRGLISAGQRVLVAASGGPDSTCLLLTIASLRRSLRITIEAAHFDHGLRARRAAKDEERTVRRLADALGVPLHTGAGDVGAHARAKHLSIEEAARELRYRFLADVAREARYHVVAVGHTLDDQAETVLLHILRGSGLSGLAGMQPWSPWPFAVENTPRLIRPLLVLSREDTERCCREAGLTPVKDASNRSLQFTRNRLRRELLPRMRAYNPRVGDALVRLAEAAAADLRALETLAAKAIASRPRGGEVRLRRRTFAGLPEALQRHAVRLAFERLLGDKRGLGERHVRALIHASSRTGSRLDLPRDVRAEVTRDAVVLLRRGATPRPLPTRAVSLPVPGSARLGPWILTAEPLTRKPRDLAAGAPDTAVLDADVLGASLTVRRRRPGDRFQPLGLAQAKKLQDFLVDAHVPRSERDALPLVLAARGIVWVVGQRPAEWARVSRSTRRFVRLRAQRELDIASGVR